jgi:hypothetical protein
MAMRRTSWIDQRINGGAVVPWSLPWSGVSFFGWWRISAIADRSHHGEGKHYQ